MSAGGEKISSQLNRTIEQELAEGGVSVGVLVAVLESLCTGQVYLPTIVFVARSPGLRVDALVYLILYNLMFIAPLIVSSWLRSTA